MSEVWKTILGFEGRYEISDLGRVRSLPREWCPTIRVLKPRAQRDGYLIVVLYDESRRAHQILVHRLVCSAFIGEPPADKPHVNHIDGVKNHNAPSNLEWTNARLNAQHAIHVLGTRRGESRHRIAKVGKNNPGSKPVVQINSNGTCKRFDGVNEAARLTGLNFRHISNCCLGKRKQHGGFEWRFEDSAINQRGRIS